jgi:hypothetical protein
MTQTRRYSDAGITAQLSSLASMKMTDLWALWDTHFRKRPGTWSRDYVINRIAYKIQEQAYGGIDADLKRRLIRMGEKHSNIQTAKNPAELLLLPGTALVRHYGEHEHRVVVLPDGQFEYQGKAFKSLSVIARFITGTHRSGPVFFGLRKETSKKREVVQ